MVRAMVGTIVDVGREHISIEEFKEIIDAKDRQSAGMAAPPQGLFLEEVVYETASPWLIFVKLIFWLTYVTL